MSRPGPDLHPSKRTQPQDWKAPRTPLATYGFDLDVHDSPKQFVSGHSNLNYLVKMDGTHWVLRRTPAGVLPPGGNDITYGVLAAGLLDRTEAMYAGDLY